MKTPFLDKHLPLGVAAAALLYAPTASLADQQLSNIPQLLQLEVLNGLSP